MEHKAPLWRVLLGGTIFMAIAGVPLLMFGVGILGPGFVLIAALASPFLGATFIWKFVRWINDRDDPRQQKPPPAAP